MGKRVSYLQQIAAPFAHGMPVLHPLPQAQAGEARPEAPPAAAVPAGGPPRHHPAARALAPARTGPAAAGDDSGAHRSKPVGATLRASPASGLPAAPNARAAPADAAPPGPFAATAPDLHGEPETTLAAAHEPTGTLAASDGKIDPAPPQPAAKLAWGEAVVLPQDAAARSTLPARAGFPPRQAVAPQASPVGNPAPAHAEQSAATVIHIGHIEVRGTPAIATPSPVPAPRPAPGAAATRAPVARGYGWRFGLNQG